jgi:acyl-coenzyme A synthetase/AMP-(fatty) acid ligase
MMEIPFWQLARFGDATAAINEEGNTLSYRQLGEEIAALQAHLPARSLAFCLCDNSFGALTGYLACLNAGAVPLMLDSSIAPELSDGLLETYRPGFVWQPAGREAANATVIYSALGYELLATGHSEVEMYDDLALLMATSGSTGSPKLVRQSYQNLLSNARSIVEYLGIDAAERPLAWLPMNYVYGLSVINTHLAQGATLLLTNSGPVQPAFWRFLKEQRATSLSGVPYSWEMLKKLRFFRMDLPSLRTITQAGGKLRAELQSELGAWAQEKQVRFFVMYGASEATSRMGYLPPERVLDKPGSLGVAIPAGRFALIDETGESIIEPGVTGELVYYGSNVTLGYAQCREDLAKGDERAGRLATGDLARVDDEGFYTIVGRKKRFLKVFGNRVGLDEIEHLVLRAFPQLDCVAAGYDDNIRVFITDGSASEAVKSYLAQTCRLHHSALRVAGIAEIPKNRAGKTLYAQLEPLYDRV